MGLEPTDKIEFVDSKGGIWNLKLDLGKARQIDASDPSTLTDLKFTFINPGRDFFAEVFSNVNFAMFLVWVIVQDQVTKVMNVRISQDPNEETYDPQENPSKDLLLVSYDRAELMFLERLDGNAIHDGKEALHKALADFFPSHRIVLSRLTESFQKVEKRQQMEMGEMSGRLDEMLTQEMDKVVSTAKSDLEKLGKTLGEPSMQPSAS